MNTSTPAREQLLRDPLFWARADATDVVLKAWAEQLAEDAKLRDVEQRLIDSRLAVEAQRLRDEYLRASLDLAEAERAVHEAQSKVVLARSSDSRTLAPGLGYQASIAAALPAYASVAAHVSDLLREVGEDDSETLRERLSQPGGMALRSALSALDRGELPNPGDLAALLEVNDLYPELTDRLYELDDRVAAARPRSRPEPVLAQAARAEAHKAVLREYVSVLATFSATNVVLLLSHPELLNPGEEPVLPPVPRSPPVAAGQHPLRMGFSDFMRLMNLFEPSST